MCDGSTLRGDLSGTMLTMTRRMTIRQNMNEDEILKKLKGLEYTPSKEADDRISWMLKNSYENEKKSVTESQAEGNKKQSNLFLNKIKMKYKTFALVGAPVVTLGVLSVLGIMYVSPMIFPKTNSLKLTQQQKREIYKSILENNSQMNTQTQTMNSQENYNTQEVTLPQNANQAVAQADQKAVVETKLVPLPGNIDFTKKIVTTVTTNTKGPKAGECKSIYDPGLISADKYESVSYYDDEGNYVSKSTEYYADNLVLYYSRSTKNESENIEYKGGKYAVKSIYSYQPELLETDAVVEERITEETVSNYMPLDTSLDNSEKNSDENIDDLIEKYFGEGTDIVGEEVIDGKKFYILEYSYESECDYSYDIYETPDFWNGEDYDSTENKADMTKITIRNYVDINDYSVVRTDTFLGEADDSNLVYTSTSAGSEKNSDIDTALAEIKFDLDVPIKEYEPQNIPMNINQNEEKEIIKYLQSNNFPILKFASGEYDLNRIYASGYYESKPIKDEYLDLIQNRNFYPEGDFGDKLFDQYYRYSYDYQTDFKNPVISWDYIVTGNNLNSSYLAATLYDGKYSDMDIVKTLVYRPVRTKSIDDVELNINGEKVTAKLYKYQTEYEDIVYDEPVYKEGEEPGSAEPGSAYSDEKQMMIVDPMPIEGNGNKKKFVDSNYTLIIPVDGGKYKLVISDYAYDSKEYAPSLELMIASKLNINYVNEFDEAELKSLVTWADVMPIDGVEVSEPQTLPR
ncbi:hypothetical protein KBD45_02305 [Candidatus Dojkabacteria bacterium]|nr:hypothetical protein [Candidatus Dojkabacteria bacterium]